MSKTQSLVPPGFPKLLKEVKARIQQAQTRAVLSANAELVRLYWDIGRMIDQRQQQQGWGAGIIPRLARDLRNELPEVKGFSVRNIGLMLTFFREYPDASAIGQQPVAQLRAHPKVSQAVAQLRADTKSPLAAAKLGAITNAQQAAAQLPDAALWSIPWFHHVVLMAKVKDLPTRLWYMQQTLANGWSRNVLLLMIKSDAHRRQGKAITNFERLLPAPQSDLVQQTLKDPYIFDFLTLEEPFHERELETNLLHQLERFLLELGQGFAFVGRQFHLDLGDSDFYIDLLFYHLKLRSFFVIDLKKGQFKPEHAGKMNFYLSVVDDRLRHETDAPSIGLILCQDRNQIIAEYALRGADKPIGISEYELTRALPPGLKSALPTVEEIEAELEDAVSDHAAQPLALPAPTKHKAARQKRKPTRKIPPKTGRRE
jgi:predicted nuclease of restriction endonuclease-like (RecB) superfamily